MGYISMYDKSIGTTALTPDGWGRGSNLLTDNIMLSLSSIKQEDNILFLKIDEVFIIVSKPGKKKVSEVDETLVRTIVIFTVS